MNNREFNNQDLKYPYLDNQYGIISTMINAINCEEIALACSPRHTQSVLEDMQKLIVGMALQLQEFIKQEKKD